MNTLMHRLLTRLTAPPARKRRPRRGHTISTEQLEVRQVLSATFGSAVGIGSDTGSSSANDVTTDQAGNSYMTGSFSGTVDFDPAAAHSGDKDILTARGDEDIYIAKYTPENSLVWVQRMGGDSLRSYGVVTDTARKIEVDGSGNVYVVGDFRGSADFGSTTLTTAGDKDVFVTKLGADGAIQWARSWGAAQLEDSGMGVGVDNAGNVYALGLQSKGPNNGTIGNANPRYHKILKYSSTGTAVWSRSIEVNSTFSSGDLAVDGAGNTFTVGSFRGIVDFDPGTKTKYVSSGPMPAGFVLKLDTSGKLGWVSPFLGQTVNSTTGFSWASSVALDNSGNVIVGGSYQSTVDFNPGNGTTTLPVGGGGFITKLNAAGGLLWARALTKDTSSVSNSASVYGLDVDAAGSIYATGLFTGAVDFDPGAGVQSQTSTGANNGYVLKLSSAGNFGWVNTFAAMSYGVAVDTTGNVLVAGRYTGIVDFDADPFEEYFLTTLGTFSKSLLLRLRQS